MRELGLAVIPNIFMPEDCVRPVSVYFEISPKTHQNYIGPRRCPVFNDVLDDEQ